MYTKSIGSQIFNTLKRYKKKWYSVGELENSITGHYGSTVSRQARHMAEQDEIHKEYRIINGHRLVFYRWK